MRNDHLSQWLQLTVCAAALTFAMAENAGAQQAQQSSSASTGSSDAIPEVVVTARKIAEDVQKVPEAVTTFTAEQITDSRIQSIDDVIAMTPNFDIFHAETAGNFQMSIRGITQVDKGDAPVTMVIDGVTLPYASSFTQPLFDIEQVEVLKGPQGSLYGQNAIGGAVLVTTKQPTDDFSGNLDVSYGNDNQTNVTATLSGPIVPDRLFFRVAGAYHNDSGDLNYLLYPNESADYNRSGEFRAELKAIITDSLTADLAFGIGRESDNGLPLVPVTESPGSGITGVSTTQLNQGLVLGEPNQDYMEHNEENLYDASLHLSYDAGFATFSSVSALQYMDLLQHQDIDVTAYPFVYVVQEQRFHAVSEEFRATSNSSGPLRWVAGVFYLDNHRLEDYTIYANLSLLTGASLSPAAAVYIPFEADNNAQDLESRAAFGQVSYDILDNLELTFGARYDSDPRSQLTTGFEPGGAPLLNTQSKTFNQFQPKVSLRWQFDPDANVYFTYAEGFRPGGFNSGVSTNVSNAFPAETTQTYEAGFKSTLFDRHLVLDAAVFHTDYQNQQLGLIQVTPQGVSTNTYDVKSTTINGGELSIEARPLSGLTVASGFGYTDSTIEQFGNSLFGAQFSPAAYVGKNTPIVPQFTWNNVVQYRHPIMSSIDGVVRVETETKGRVYWYPDNVNTQAPYTLVNVKAGFEGDNWEVRFYGDNILDKKYYVLYEDNRFVQAPGGFNFAFLSLKPRYGVDLSYHF